ncbi:phosphoribosyltransferase family protein [Streptomyces niveiscabiei]|uniref:phosphoribosyltransferase n=1 Tax=Streptomyces niveiscabiei TaxID=164115 RepID=UPI0029BEEF45|nr:phosphoribosyltransferase family protein [Streptomyces niveiscabiei]MDX3387232.1 phosphoribosyltransferase family protein [Streptomyces niveiscabiei]
MRYDDRRAAGRQLAGHLGFLRQRLPVVLGLPRDGVPVAYEVARALDAPLDVLVVRKLGLPGQPEVGFGAVGEDEVLLLDDGMIARARLTAAERESVLRAERAELDRRLRLCRAVREAVPLSGRTVVIVDDGLATGVTAEAACRIARRRGTAAVVLAVPVAAEAAVRRLRTAADAVVCPRASRLLGSVGAWYRDFGQISDAEVTELLGRAAASGAQPPRAR